MKLLCRITTPGLNIEFVNLYFSTSFNISDFSCWWPWQSPRKARENKTTGDHIFSSQSLIYIPSARIHSVDVLNKHFAEVKERRWCKMQHGRRGNENIYMHRQTWSRKINICWCRTYDLYSLQTLLWKFGSIELIRLSDPTCHPSKLNITPGGIIK